MAGTSSLEEIFRDIDSRLNEVHGDIIERLSVLLNQLHVLSYKENGTEIDILLPFYFFTKKIEVGSNKYSPVGNVILPWCRRIAPEEVSSINANYSILVKYYDDASGYGHKELYANINTWLSKNAGINFPWPGRDLNEEIDIINKVIEIETNSSEISIPHRLRNADKLVLFDFNLDEVSIVFGIIINSKNKSVDQLVSVVNKYFIYEKNLKQIDLYSNCSDCDHKCNDFKIALCHLWQDINRKAIINGTDKCDILFASRFIRPPSVHQRGKFEWFPTLTKHYSDKVKSQYNDVEKLKNSIVAWKDTNEDNKKDILKFSINNIFINRNNIDDILKYSFEILDKYSFPLNMALANSSMDHNAIENIEKWSEEIRVKEISLHHGEVDENAQNNAYPADLLVAEKIVYPQSLSEGALFIPIKAPANDIDDKCDRPSFALVIIGIINNNIDIQEAIHIVNSYARNIHDLIIEDAIKEIINLSESNTSVTIEKKKRIEHITSTNILRIKSLSSTVKSQEVDGLVKYSYEPKPYNIHNNYAHLIDLIKPRLYTDIFEWLNENTKNWFRNKEDKFIPSHNYGDDNHEDYKNTISKLFPWLKNILEEKNDNVNYRLHEDLKTICGTTTCWSKVEGNKHAITLGGILLLYCIVVHDVFDSKHDNKLQGWIKEYYNVNQNDKYCGKQSEDVSITNAKILINMFNNLVKNDKDAQGELLIKDITFDDKSITVTYNFRETDDLRNSVLKSNIVFKLNEESHYPNSTMSILAWKTISEISSDGYRCQGRTLLEKNKIIFQSIH